MPREAEMSASLPTAPAPNKPIPFGVNEVRLGAPQWLLVGLIILSVAVLVPWFWPRVEPLSGDSDYRIPYALSKDYWLYSRRLRQVSRSDQVLVLGDSVIWGEYVLPDGTLSHFLNREARGTNHFVNAGLNGLFPLAEEGLVRYYSRPARRQRIILAFNFLWLTSPKADLSTTKEEQFNHSRLVPQWSPRLPCYKADANERLSATIEHYIPFLSWIEHLQAVYFGGKSILAWTLEEDGSNPPRRPNAWKNPLAQISLRLPSCYGPDPERGPASPRHKTWSEKSSDTTSFEWVPLESSLQWGAFKRVLEILQRRHDDVLVVVGPFNEHMLADDNRAPYEHLREEVAGWLKLNRIPHIVPESLPSEFYADASHPLTEGYELLAKRLYEDASFRQWLQP